jgi:2-polyprenyl-6-methoxyphenol hydroxylase-like FAD-dependent oxidoreductase
LLSIEIQWGKGFADFRENDESATAIFEDGSSCLGRLILGCDGNRSQVRRVLYRGLFATSPIPVRLFGFTLRVSAEEAAPIRTLDPFFLQGTASTNNIYMYLSRKS